MITLRPKLERGHADHGWLNTYHTFSFADYMDPRQMGFRSLRVINEDWVKPGYGFGMHGHRNMEIITVVLQGALEHKDTMGNTSIINPGEVQYMCAGTGVMHSEFNPSESAPVHLYQIWILPNNRELEPRYQQDTFPLEERDGRLQLVASGDGTDGSIRINQDARLYVSALRPNAELTYNPGIGRYVWLQTTSGELMLNGHPLSAGDGAAVEGEQLLTIVAKSDAEFLLFDLA